MIPPHKIFALTILSCLSLVTAPAYSKGPACSNKTLKGPYTYSIQGLDAGKPYAESGMETFFGDGTLLSRYTENQTGTPATSHATYQIEADCHGVIHYDYGSIYHIYASPDGKSSAYIRTQPQGAISGIENRVSKQLIQ